MNLCILIVQLNLVVASLRVQTDIFHITIFQYYRPDKKTCTAVFTTA